MRRIFTMIQKEFRQIFRDRPMVAIIFMIPLIQLFILAHAVTTDVKHIKTIFIDFDKSELSREIYRKFFFTDYFRIVDLGTDLQDISQKMKRWEVQMALVIPTNFKRDLQRGLKPKVQIVVDGVDGNTAGVALAYATSILSEFGIDISRKNISQMTLKKNHMLSMIERMWYNLDLNSKQYMVPGIVVVLLTILPMMLSSMSLVKEKEIGTLEQLMVTPLTKHQLLLGKIVPFLILTYIELFFVMGAAILAFKLQVNGSILLIAFLAFIYLFTTLGFGIFISTFTHSQQQAMFVSWFFLVFMILMSGFFIPIENMPVVLQRITYIDPMRYFMSIVRDIFQKGSTLRHLWVDILPMTAFGLTIFTFGILKFRKRIS
jgi:ABC-2 type transport system permease protein